MSIVDSPSFLNEFFYLNFNILNFDGRYLRIGGAQSPSFPFDCGIILNNVIMLDCPFTWAHYGPDYVEEIVEISDKLRKRLIYNYNLPIDEGYNVYKFNSTVFGQLNSYYVVAKSISYLGAVTFHEMLDFHH